MASQDWKKRPIAIQWDGVSDLIAGDLYYKSKKQNGRIKLTLPGSRGQCSGSYKIATRDSGVWSIACTEGMTASGTMVVYGAGNGSSGDGRDNNGRAVKFTVGGASN